MFEKPISFPPSSCSEETVAVALPAVLVSSPFSEAGFHTEIWIESPAASTQSSAPNPPENPENTIWVLVHSVTEQVIASVLSGTMWQPAQVRGEVLSAMRE